MYYSAKVLIQECPSSARPSTCSDHVPVLLRSICGTICAYVSYHIYVFNNIYNVRDYAIRTDRTHQPT